jgi:signal transduction histidine kinase
LYKLATDLSVHTLRADTRDEETLEAAIADLIENFRQSTGITILKKIETQLILSPQTVKTLYRVIQETLTNICKHAQATEVQLQLQTSEDRVYLTIEDNGQGFCPEIRSEGFGLQGMRERVVALGGQFQLVSQPGAGCRTTVNLPLSGLLTSG